MRARRTLCEQDAPYEKKTRPVRKIAAGAGGKCFSRREADALTPGQTGGPASKERGLRRMSGEANTCGCEASARFSRSCACRRRDLGLRDQETFFEIVRESRPHY